MNSKFMLETNNTYLEVFPDELNLIQGIPGGVDLRIGSMILHCQIFETEYWRKRQLVLQDAELAAILASVYIYEGESYTIRTEYCGNYRVLVSKNTLPASLSSKVGWAFGFTARNKLTMDGLQDKYRTIYDTCNANESSAIYKVFSPWLHAAYQAPKQRRVTDPTVYWATPGVPDHNEALDLMRSMTGCCANTHNRSRINYVIDRVQAAM